MDDRFVAIINQAVEKFGYGDRAKLIREAIAEKLKNLGMKVPDSLAATPTRLGKGGRSSTRKNEDSGKTPF